MTELKWDFGTAYDFFISLFVIHYPDRFGLRASWAAGVRSRLPIAHRQFLEQTLEFLSTPLTWLNSLEIPFKDTAHILQHLTSLDPQERLKALLTGQGLTPQVWETVQKLEETKTIVPSDLESLRKVFRKRLIPVRARTVRLMAQAFTDGHDFGEKLLSAYQTYYHVFFKEEESRISPFLERGLRDAQKKAQKLPLQDLFDELSKGVSYESFEAIQRLWLVPSYWGSPRIFLTDPRMGERLMVFGCRSPEENLIPGEYVSERLINTLKSLSDPTRLRITHYLQETPQTPSSLARKLRLRPPTIVHHLTNMRLAGLVQVKISKEGERSYALNDQTIRLIIQQLESYLHKPPAA